MSSKELEAFLDYFRTAQEEYNIAAETVKDAEAATQDILHRLELFDDSYHDQARLAKTLKDVRQERRNAKDRMQALQPIVEWANSNQKTIKELERLLGAVRKIEKSQDGRYYNPRTDIIDQALQGRNLLC